MGDGWSEQHVDIVFIVIDLDLILSHHIQLLQCEGMLGIVDVSDEVEYFFPVHRVRDGIVPVSLRQNSLSSPVVQGWVDIVQPVRARHV